MAEGTRRQTTMGGPVYLPDPTSPPRPTPGCDVCAALDEQREQAERKRDYKRATTLEQEMRSHPRHTEQS
ncbi:hypothetical protein ABZ890_39800 [Streptomyces sp. NPDC046984]|uniref:hypothetical protein n=1 Tax=Streptomyces sp. NPDC046984 TaxID=3155138 RepID=UPI0033DE8151